jgi:hypothetical protein
MTRLFCCDNEYLVNKGQACDIYDLWACEFEYSRHSRVVGNVLCFSKLQQAFTCFCSIVTLEVWCIVLDKVCS